VRVQRIGQRVTVPCVTLTPERARQVLAQLSGREAEEHESPAMLGEKIADALLGVHDKN
jgi:hypothetical protein